MQLTVISGDGQRHAVVVQTPPGQHPLEVPASGRATLRLPGLKAGDYTIEIDRKPRAKLIIGGEPGP